MTNKYIEDNLIINTNKKEYNNYDLDSMYYYCNYYWFSKITQIKNINILYKITRTDEWLCKVLEKDGKCIYNIRLKKEFIFHNKSDILNIIAYMMLEDI